MPNLDYKNFAALWCPPGFRLCSCELRCPCLYPTRLVCPLCEEPFCEDCLQEHHRCTQQPEHLAVPDVELAGV